MIQKMTSLCWVFLALLCPGIPGLGCSDGNGGSDPAYVFRPFEGRLQPADPSARLCAEAADPSGALDKTFIDCSIEGENLAGNPETPKSVLVIVEYNMERGYALDRQVSLLRDNPEIPRADVLLLSEVDRGCSRTGGKHIARELASALGMNYLYAVEFIELPRQGGPGDTIESACEHGNAILSRFPMGNVRSLRYQNHIDWYSRSEEPRLGGRVALLADIKVGDRYLHLASTHLESSVSEEPRYLQAGELADELLKLPFGSVVAGDMNCGFYAIDLDSGSTIDKTYRAFRAKGLVDAHAGLTPKQRVTAPKSGFIIDLILGLKVAFSQPGVCPRPLGEDLSDHLPIWTQVDLSAASGRE